MLIELSEYKRDVTLWPPSLCIDGDVCVYLCVRANQPISSKLTSAHSSIHPSSHPASQGSDKRMKKRQKNRWKNLKKVLQKFNFFLRSGGMKKKKIGRRKIIALLKLHTEFSVFSVRSSPLWLRINNIIFPLHGNCYFSHYSYGCCRRP